MSNSNKVNGIICPAITFFDDNLHVNVELNSLLYRHIHLNGANAIFLFGSTGEGHTFLKNYDEKATP